MTQPMFFMGVDTRSSRPPFTYVVLDERLRICFQGRAQMADLLELVLGQAASCWVAIQAPCTLNKGLLLKPEIRQQFTPPPAAGRYLNLRYAEYNLIQAGMRVPLTPDRLDKAPKWFQRGIQLRQKLEQAGYMPYPAENTALQWLETQAEAGFYALLGVLPFPSHTLEGRLQRQLVLFDLGIPVPDPLSFFEEITRYRLLHSILPTEKLLSSAMLNALLSAYTAWLAANQPQQALKLGNPQEGWIVLPAKSLPLISAPQ